LVRLTLDVVVGDVLMTGDPAKPLTVVTVLVTVVEALSTDVVVPPLVVCWAVCNCVVTLLPVTVPLLGQAPLFLLPMLKADLSSVQLEPSREPLSTKNQVVPAESVTEALLSGG